MTEVWARQTFFVSFVDARDVTWSDQAYRKDSAALVRELEDGSPPFRVATAIVIHSPVARAAMSALNALIRASNPPVVVATPREAAGVLERRWAAARGALPRALVDGLREVRLDRLDLPPVPMD